MTSFVLSTGISAFISAALSIWMIVCMWIIFKKAGRKGWESLIPVWNVYVLFKIAGKKGWFWVLLLLPILWIAVSVISWLTMQSGNANEYSTIYSIKNMVNWVLGLLALILPLMAWITLPYGLTKKFGKSNWFYIGMLFLTPIFFGILAFSDTKYEGVEFNEKYNLKKWLLITLGVSLLIGCCDAGIKYYQYKDFYNYFNNSEYDYEVSDEITNNTDPKKSGELKINSNEKNEEKSGYIPTNITWIDEIARNYKGEIIKSNDLIDPSKDGRYRVKPELKKRTLFIDESNGFVLEIGPMWIGSTMEIYFNDINEISSITVHKNNGNIGFNMRIYPHGECDNMSWRYNNEVVWDANDNFVFTKFSSYESNMDQVKLTTHKDSGKTLEELLVENHCVCDGTFGCK